MKRTFVPIVLAICALMLGVAGAETRLVPDDYESIQSAIDVAEVGDVVVVKPGTYIEAIDFLGKDIIVRSLDPNDPDVVATTVIAMPYFGRERPAAGSVVTFVGGESPDAELAGLTIRDGFGTILPGEEASGVRWGAGILCVGSAPTIRNNLIIDNQGPLGSGTSDATSGYGGAIACVNSDAVIVSNVLRGNAAYAGAGVFVSNGTPRIANNVIYDNLAVVGGGAILLYGGSMLNNTIMDNAADAGGGLYLVSDSIAGHYNVVGNIICQSRSGGGIYRENLFFGDRLAFNDIWGNQGDLGSGVPIEEGADGNISVDPMVLGQETGDFRLHMDSPCINAGDPDYAELPGETDFYGDPRLCHGRVDIGATEFAGSLRPIADAGPDQMPTDISAVVTFDAGGSYDPDGNEDLFYHWTQISGPSVELETDGALAWFTLNQYGAYEFELVVDDGVFESFPDIVRVVIDNGLLPIAEAGRPVYAGQNAVALDGSGSYSRDPMRAVTYQWRQLSGPSVVVTEADTVAPVVSGFRRSSELQTCVFQLIVDDGQYTSMPDTVELFIIPTTPGITIHNESGTFDPNKPTVIYFGGGDCVTGGGSWGSSDWNARANVLNFDYGPDGSGSSGQYFSSGDALLLYLAERAPDYKMPIQTIGWSTGGQPAIDSARRLNLFYRDTRYAINRVTFVDARCRGYSATIREVITNPVDGEQCWVDSYDAVPVLNPGALNAHVSNGDHGTPPTYYRISLTNDQMNDYNGGLVAGSYWSVIGPGKNLQLSVRPNEMLYLYRGYDAVSPGYGYMQFYDEQTGRNLLPEPVRLLPLLDVGDPNGAVLTCEPSQNAVGYELLLGRDPYRVMDFEVISDTPTPPMTVVRELPYGTTWWTVRARDAQGSTIYADPVPIRALDLTLPVMNITSGQRYATIQSAVDDAVDGAEIQLQPGIYTGTVDLGGKALSIQSIAPSDLAITTATILDARGAATVVTSTGTGGGSVVLEGLTITNGENGVYCEAMSLTMTNCRVIANQAAGIKLWDEAVLTASRCLIAGNAGAGVEMWCDIPRRIKPYNYATITNCTIAENGGAGVWGGKPTVTSSILWDNAGDPITGDVVIVTYSDIQGGYEGLGNIDADPRFVQAGQWGGSTSVPGDYHLMSQGGRWDSSSATWVSDEVTSPCIDAGDPALPLLDEPMSLPSGPVANVQINMGMYGGTAEASVQ